MSQVSLTDEKAFAAEQEKLGRVWTFLGLTADLKKDNDWFRATLGGRSVFVQRFGNEIVGFENVCAHRFFPLRTSDKGNGPIVCGFHHWHYDRTGEAVGIPICQELFGGTPREIGARLTPVEIAVCGSLVFGRLAAAGGGESLKAFLGAAWPILTALSTLPSTLHAFGGIVEANWRLMVNITLDDYHTVAVHDRPKHQKTADIQYWRFGLHSAHAIGKRHTLQSMAEECRADPERHRPSGYKIFNIFPNLAVGLFKARPFWYANIQQFVPVSPGRSEWRGWFYRTIFPAADRSARDRLLRPFPDAIRARVVRRSLECIARQDHAACERLQEVAGQAGKHPILGAQETRIGWFQEAYERTMQGVADVAGQDG
ncbi:MAG: Rieske 2Fe-2S domain-containing protein [Alphaproteobacteria bacterium]|nr:Rieske 2Fe-2S domain-containing protein [Alphaproteobacteria bacterium]